MSDEVSTHELEALRRRAYGPDADIDSDPAALARLIALEDLAHRHEPAPGDALAGGEPDAAAPAAPILNAEPGSGPVPATLLTPPPRRTRGHTTAVVAIAVVTLALGVTASRGANAPDASAPSFTADP
ncbi:MAG: hypothetical protein KKH75_01160, partial [Actinobacteria bacterium]|nr:hypothetical protein [Actinomycetota bacterium]